MQAITVGNNEDINSSCLEFTSEYIECMSFVEHALKKKILY